MDTFYSNLSRHFCLDVDRHHARVITLEYVGSGDIKSTYMFVGKVGVCLGDL